MFLDQTAMKQENCRTAAESESWVFKKRNIFDSIRQTNQS